MESVVILFIWIILMVVGAVLQKRRTAGDGKKEPAGDEYGKRLAGLFGYEGDSAEEEGGAVEGEQLIGAGYEEYFPAAGIPVVVNESKADVRPEIPAATAKGTVGDINAGISFEHEVEKEPYKLSEIEYGAISEDYSIKRETSKDLKEIFPKDFRDAVILYEILGPPKAFQ